MFPPSLVRADYAQRVQQLADGGNFLAKVSLRFTTFRTEYRGDMALVRRTGQCRICGLQRTRPRAADGKKA